MGYNIHNIYPLIHDFDDFPSSQRASRRPVASSLWTSRLSARRWRRSTPRGRWPWPMPRSASLGEPKDVDVKKRFVLLCFFGGWLWVSDCEIVVPKWTFFFYYSWFWHFLVERCFAEFWEFPWVNFRAEEGSLWFYSDGRLMETRLGSFVSGDWENIYKHRYIVHKGDHIHISSCIYIYIYMYIIHIYIRYIHISYIHIYIIYITYIYI